MKRILHLGVGNFHRAHQAWYTQQANEIDADDAWTITGVSLRRADVRDMLKPQGFTWTLAISDADGERLQRIDVMDEILVAPEDPLAVVQAIADPGTAIVTLTVTEKGYDLGTDGSLALQSTAIASDVVAVGEGRLPGSTIGLLSMGLAARARHGAPLTVLSCDNLPANGAKLEAAVRTFATAAGLALDAYLSKAVRFPGSMVDRITPATDEALCKRVAASDLPPAGPVATEAFTEWVIEDRFAGPRPHWEAGGAVFTADVEPYEHRKIRLLNGAHSYLAYAGTLAGHEFVHEAIADETLRQTCIGLMEEAASTLPESVRHDVDEYRTALLERFANPGLKHRLRQIAMDGSLKLPIRILTTWDVRAAAGMPHPACDVTLTAWRDFLAAEIEAGRTVDDPAADRLVRGITCGADALTLLNTTSDS